MLHNPIKKKYQTTFIREPLPLGHEYISLKYDIETMLRQRQLDTFDRDRDYSSEIADLYRPLPGTPLLSPYLWHFAFLRRGNGTLRRNVTERGSRGANAKEWISVTALIRRIRLATYRIDEYVERRRGGSPWRMLTIAPSPALLLL